MPSRRSRARAGQEAVMPLDAFMVGFEDLEPRRLFSSQVILQIDGSDNPDTITVSSDSSKITVVENGKTSNFNLGQITRVVINANSGNDKIDCSLLKINAIIKGDNGDDTVIGSEKSDKIYGGDGMDSLVGGKGNDRINGDEEDDTLRGGKGADSIDGGDGKDVLTGDEDNDDLDADDDVFVDTLTGGAGIDHAKIDNAAGIEDDVTDTIEDVDD
jgi:Ca2+-binding RTX toxin-like protein